MYKEDKSSLCMYKVDKEDVFNRAPKFMYFSRHINMQISQVIGIKNILFTDISR